MSTRKTLWDLSIFRPGVAALLTLAGAACAGVDYGSYLNRWVGSPESRLVAAWGAPDWPNEAADGSAELHYIYEEPVFEIIGSADGDRYVHECLTTFRVVPRERGRSCRPLLALCGEFLRARRFEALAFARGLHPDLA